MARTKGAKKLKSLEQLVVENETKIQEAEKLLKLLYEERSNLAERKEQADMESLVKIIKDNGISIAEAKDILIRKGQE